jgi:hypothetical protein
MCNIITTLYILLKVSCIIVCFLFTINTVMIQNSDIKSEIDDKT